MTPEQAVSLKSAAHRQVIRATRPGSLTRGQKAMRAVKGALLSPAYVLGAHWLRVPGLGFRWKAWAWAFTMGVRGRIRPVDAYRLSFLTLDSTRYFEFDFFWEAAQRRSAMRYLDVSSPRLFPLAVVKSSRTRSALFVNPDSRDLQQTKTLAQALGVAERCEFSDALIADINGEPSSFDFVTCMSVVEHIPDDTGAIQTMWNLVAPGGSLCVSVPCAAEESEQFRDFDEYGLVPREADGTVFFQRYYSERSLRERLLSVTGPPRRQALYGEIECGLFRRNADAKLGDPQYAFWREPWMMGREYKRYQRVSELPGEGVIAMEFVKQ